MPEIKSNLPQESRREFLKKSAKALLGLSAASLVSLSCDENALAGPDRTHAPEKKKFADKLVKIIENGETMEIEEMQQIAKQIRSLSPNIISELQELTKEKDLKTRYCAYYALAILCFCSPEDKQQELLVALKPGLADKAIHLRSLVARNLVYFGDQDGIPVLIEGLDSKLKDISMPSEPPRSLPSYSLSSLTSFTDQDYGYDQAKWQSWWQTNKHRLQWNKQCRQFITLK